MRRRILLPVALLSVAVLAAGALLVAVGGGSAGGTLASGRSIAAHSDSFYLACEFGRDSAVVRTAFDSIVVKPDRVQRGDDVLARLDENAKRVELFLENGAVVVVADGRRIDAPAKPDP